MISSLKSPVTTVARAQLCAASELAGFARPTGSRGASFRAAVINRSLRRFAPLCFENTTFGISFIGAAIGSLDVGQ
jgi:hypothetical protein